MRRFLLPLAVAVVLANLSGQPAAVASPPSDSTEAAEREFSGKMQLPSWEDTEFRENFDVRIWPDEIIRWLEQENIKDIIADPDTPEEERQSLKMILAKQNAWRST